MKKPHPGFLWALSLIAGLFLAVNKYRMDKAIFFKFSWVYIWILLFFAVSAGYTYFYDRKKSQTTALASFIFGLVIFIPLLNLIFAIPAILFGIRAIKKIRSSPEKFGGITFAIVGIALGAFIYITYLTGVGMCLYGFKGICANIGLQFLAN